MKYKRIRASLSTDKFFLNRDFFIDENMTLMEFAYVLENLFRMEDCHLFRFVHGRRSFMPSKWAEEGMAEDLEDITWEDLGRKFRFVYDFGDWWEFEIFVFKRIEERDDKRRVIVLDGAGAGIWEDAHSAFDHFLLDLKLPSEEPYEEGWMPWNMSDLDRIEDTLIFEREHVQEAVDDFVAYELEGKIEELTSVSISDPALWDHYNTFMDHLLSLNPDDPRRYEMAEAAYDLFSNACTVLKEKNILPQMMAELMADEHGPGNLMCLLQELPDIYMDAGQYELLLGRMEQLKDLFECDHVLEGFADGIIFECMLALKRYGEAAYLIEEWKDIYPESSVIPAAKIHLLTAEGKYSEAEELVNQYLDENTACDEDTYPLFQAAYDFYRDRNPEKAKYYSEIINTFDSAAALNTDEYDNFTEASDELQFAISRFVLHKSRERYSLACACFVMLCQDDGDVVMHVVNPNDPDHSMPLLITSDKNEEFVVVYSTFDAANERNYYLETAFPVMDVLSLTLEAGIEGIVVDPDEDGNGLFIHADTLSEIQRVLNEKEASDHHALFLS